MPTQHPRPWIAAVLIVFFSPLGLLYVRRFKLALLFFAFPLGFRMLAYVTGGAVSLAASVARSRAGSVLSCSPGAWRNPAPSASCIGPVAGTACSAWRWRWRPACMSRACSFYEPFLMPASAMLPTAGRGDRLLVRKLGYGHLSVNTMLLGRLPASATTTSCCATAACG